MSSKDFTKEDFMQMVETYGADMSRWPEALMAPAKALMQIDPEFTAPLLKQAGDIDNALELGRMEPGTDCLLYTSDAADD